MAIPPLPLPSSPLESFPPQLKVCSHINLAPLDTLPASSSLRLNSVLPRRKVRRPLLRPLAGPRLVLRAQPPPDRACLFRSEIQR